MEEKMDIEFKRITDFPRGTLATLLKDGYSFEPKFERNWHDQWQEFDDFFMIIHTLLILVAL